MVYDQQNTSPFIDTINIRTPDTFQKSGAGGTREAGGFGAAPSVNGTAPVTVTPDYSSVGPGGDLLNIIAQAESGAGSPGGDPSGSAQNDDKKDSSDDVQDVDFEEVK